MFDISSWRSTGAALAITTLLGGCSFNGTYPDATEPDAAKLRFISSIENSTLTLFDTDHCDGRTTGLLNDWLTANTQRRADMSTAPPANTRGYLEIRLKPGSELFVQTNTVSTGSVCTAAFNFTPQRGSEYELTFDYVSDHCQVILKALHQAGGRVVRSSIPLANKGLPACAGSNALFPKDLPAQPDTPERTAMIEEIISNSIIAEMKSKPQVTLPADREKSIENLVEERKKHIGFVLPDTYWGEYRLALNRFDEEAMHTKERALQFYTDEYRARLRRVDTDEIRKLVPGSVSNDESKALAVNRSMLQFYYSAKNRVQKEALINNLGRLADLDRRYSVCDHYADCWKN